MGRLENEGRFVLDRSVAAREVRIVDSRGAARLLPEAKAPARVRSTNTRGTKFPMPMPKSGRHAHNLILAEDQLAEAADKAKRQGKARAGKPFFRALALALDWRCDTQL